MWTHIECCREKYLFTRFSLEIYYTWINSVVSVGTQHTYIRANCCVISYWFYLFFAHGTANIFRSFLWTASINSVCDRAISLHRHRFLTLYDTAELSLISQQSESLTERINVPSIFLTFSFYLFNVIKIPFFSFSCWPKIDRPAASLSLLLWWLNTFSLLLGLENK